MSGASGRNGDFERTTGGAGQFLLVVLGLNNSTVMVLSLVVAPLLVNESWNFPTAWAPLVTVAVVTGLRQQGLGPTVREAWTFGFAALFGYFCLVVIGGFGDTRLSGAVYPVVRGLLTSVAILAFACFATTLGADDVRQLAKTRK